MNKGGKGTIRSTTCASVLGLVSILAISACSSGSTGDSPVAQSSSTSSSAGAPSESVPAGVTKDSVLDLNSTKDMTGVVTTIPIDKSPYIDHLPDICQLIPDSVVRQLGATRKKKGFTGTRLVTQSCLLQPPSGALSYAISANIYVNNIRELIEQPSTKLVERDVPLSTRVVATVFQNSGSDLNDGDGFETCRVAWGTFYGSATINFNINPGFSADTCARAIEAAKAIAPYMPQNPSQMRGTP